MLRRLCITGVLCTPLSRYKVVSMWCVVSAILGVRFSTITYFVFWLLLAPTDVCKWEGWSGKKGAGPFTLV
jgi:hypothetical protein